jgi:hypothetical protein
VTITCYLTSYTFYKILYTLTFSSRLPGLLNHRRTLKLRTFYNSDGLIKCLRQRQDSFSVNPNIYAFALCSVYRILWHPDSFVYRDSIIGAVGRRSGASFFARHRDYFIVTLNFAAVYRDLVPFRNFTVTLGFAVTYRDWQKTSHRDADGT